MSTKASVQEREKRTVSLTEKYPNLRVVPESPFILHVHTMIRDRDTSRSDFLFYSDQLIRALTEYAFESCCYKEKVITTPTGYQFTGLELEREVVGVSIMRAGESMENALRSTIRGVKLGKILIQRDETSPDRAAQLFYSKLPENIDHSTVLLLDPMLASGSSARLAVKVLMAKGVPAKNIVFVNLIASPEGIHSLLEDFPDLTIVTTMIDDHINEDKFIIPGIGDFGDRYFGT